MIEGLKSDDPPALSHEERQYALEQKRYKVEKFTLFFLFLYVTISAFLWCANKKATEAAKSAADTAAQSLVFAKQQFSDDQRAWVGVENAIVHDLPNTKVGLMNIILKNSGKTPALHMHIFGVTQREKGSHLMDISDARRYPVKQLGILMPNAEATIPSKIPDSTKLGIALLKDGSYRMVSYGIVEYDDVAGRSHSTTLCIFIAPDFHNVGWCDKYNDAN